MSNIKSIFGVIILLTVTLSANAQFNLGVKGGLNVSNIQGFEYSDYNNDVNFGISDPVASFHVGLMTEFMFNPHMGIESGLYFNRLGGCGSNAFMTLDYIHMPALFLYKFRVGRDFYLYPSSGFYFAYGVAGDLDLNYHGGYGWYHGDGADFFDRNINKFDMGFVFAANLQYKKFVFSTGYEAGFLPVNKNNSPIFESQDVYFFNRNFKASVGFVF